MAERTIGLRIKLNGVQGVVSDIQTLEKFLTEAREDLKQLEIGSDLFRELSGEIAKTQRQLDELNQSTQALGTEKIVEGFSKLAGGISSAFAAATAAVNLFGADSEEASKAAADAQNLLTIALSLRGAAEIRTGAQIVARTIAERAATAATNAATTATRTFYTVLASNPYTAIIAAVGLLVGAYFALKTETDEAAEAQKEFYDAAAKDAAKTIARYETLTTVVNDSNESLTKRKKALDELKSTFPGYFKNLQDEEILSGKLKVAIDGVREAIINKSLAQALEQKLTEKLGETADDRIKLAERELKLRQQETEVKNQIAKADEDLNNGLINQAQFLNRVNAASQLQNQVGSERLGIQKEKDRLDKIDKNNTKGITLAISELTKGYGDLFVEETKTSKAQSKVNEVVSKAIQRFKELSQTLSFTYGEPKVLADLREIDKELKRLTEGPESFDEKLASTFKEGGQDIFGELYDGYRKQLSDALLLGGDELGKTIQTITAEAAEKVQTGEFNIEAFTALQSLTNEYANLQKIITEIPDITKSLGDTGYYNALKGQLLQTGQIIFDEVNGNVSLLSDEIKRIQSLGDKASESEIKKLEEYQNALNQGTSNFQKVQEKLTEQITNDLVKTGKFTKEQAQEISKARVESITNLSTTIVINEEKIRGVLFETQKLSNDIDNTLNNNTEAFKNFVLENIGLLSDEYQKVGLENKKFFEGIELNAKEQADLEKRLNELKLNDYKGYFQQRKIDADDLTQLEILLAQKGIDLEKFSADEKIKIIEEFYNKIKGFRDQNTTDEVDAFDKTLDNLSKGIQQFQTALADIGNIIAQGFELELEKLERNYNSSLDMIVGDTAEANQKRLELEQQYQAERADIEKQSRIRSLEFQLAQSVADGAASVVRTLAEFGASPVGIGLSVLAGALTAAQVGIIRQQIDFARGLAGGGVIQGLPHELGGVMAGGGYTLEGGEAVLNRNTTMDYLPLLSTLNQQGGGQPLISNASNSLMEERLLQAIAKQKSEPLRAYVLGSEITNSQAINRRLEELSTL